MKRKTLLLLLLVLTLTVLAVRAQDDDDDDDEVYIDNGCRAPAAYKFDEVLFADKARLDQVTKEFREKLYTLPAEAKGVVYIFGGQETTFDEIAEITKDVDGRIGFGNDSDGKVSFVNGGYRRNAAVVLAIRPLDCSDHYAATPDLDVDEIQFKEFPPADTVRMSRDDLKNQVAKEIFGRCTAVARAMHACSTPLEVEVFVAVDKTGTVRFAKDISGNPLLRSAAPAAAKAWKFRPLMVDGMPKNFLGVILVRFPPDASSITIDY